MNRNEILTSLQTKSPQILIVGAGINGVGTFRDLALNGVDVLLIDRGDFCSGASAASSHMAHGGIRYLENGEFRLVHEAVQERNRMITNAPHIVRPLPTVIPIFKVFSGLFNAPLKFLNLLDRPSERGAFIIKVGLMLYDAYTRSQGTVPPHQVNGRAASLKKFPHLNPEIKYTATYYDGSIKSPERYTVELVLDGEAEGDHARALNYVSLAGVKENAVTLRDELSGRTFDISPRLIINAAGPWIDPVNTTLKLERRYIGGTKGSHLVLDTPMLRAEIGDNEFFFENKDGRIVLIFPFFDKLILGTSDLPIEDADTARCTEDEVDYFIEMIDRVFPNVKIGREHIVFRFSGVRPLAYSKAKTTGQITRDHAIQEDTAGNIPVLSLVGGKWTSYRAFSEQVTDKVLGFLGSKRKADTKTLAIGGGKAYPRTPVEQEAYIRALAAETGLDSARVSDLFQRYGTRARDVALFLNAGSDTPLASRPNWTRREVQFLAEHEKAVNLDDIILRRSTLAWLGEVTRPMLDEMADILAGSLTWTGEHKQAEVARTLDLLADRHGVSLN